MLRNKVGEVRTCSSWSSGINNVSLALEMQCSASLSDLSIGENEEQRKYHLLALYTSLLSLAVMIHLCLAFFALSLSLSLLARKWESAFFILHRRSKWKSEAMRKSWAESQGEGDWLIYWYAYYCYIFSGIIKGVERKAEESCSYYFIKHATYHWGKLTDFQYFDYLFDC